MSLIERMKNGDEGATATLVKATLPEIYNFCFRLCRNADDAGDLCRDAFLKTMRGLWSIRGDAEVGTRLTREALNAWKNMIRTKKSRSSLSGTAESHDASSLQTHQDLIPPKPNGKEKHDDDQKRIHQALDKMDPEDKTLILLKDVDDLSYEQTSQILRLPMSAVKSRLSRARDRLREIHHKLRGKIV